MRHPRQAGFTLLELLVTLGVAAIVLTLFAAKSGQLSSALTRDYRSSMGQVNGRIADALRQYARHDTPLGTLPAPYTGGDYRSAVLDPANTSLITRLRAARVGVHRANDDGEAARNVRVYQRLQARTHDQPVFGQSGPVATLTYDVGVIYQTACPAAAACNTTPPGDSATLTALNLDTWTVAGADFAEAWVNLLPEQQRRLSETMRRIGMLRSGLDRHFTAAVRAAAASDTTNHFPAPNGAGAPALSGADPAANEGCRDGWFTLEAGNVNVVQQINLSQTEVSTTAWGGAIQYCRDYDPATTTADTPPHAAALRIHASVSLGLDPGPAGSNLVFPL